MVKIANNNSDQAFKSLKDNPEWSFLGKSTRYATHQAHRYPAKFPPPLCEKLILSHSRPKEVVFDPFGGCGTTQLESKILGRNSIGIDINPISVLITEAKTYEYDLVKLEACIKRHFQSIEKKNKSEKTGYLPQKNIDRINYWFKEDQIIPLSQILQCIKAVRDSNHKKLFLVAFSHILKDYSIWLQRSTKPTRDLKKDIGCPVSGYKRQVNYIFKKHCEYQTLLSKTSHKTSTESIKGDAKSLSLLNNSVDYIVTSPPYVTSYEYADLHQLSLIWLENFLFDHRFKRKFIGTTVVPDGDKNIILKSKVAKKTVKELRKKNVDRVKAIEAYFSDIRKSLEECHRVLKKGKKISIVIGDTEIKGVNVKNSEIVYQEMIDIGFKPTELIKRQVSGQSITPYRNTRSGKFTNKSDKNARQSYKYEIVITMEK